MADVERGDANGTPLRCGNLERLARENAVGVQRVVVCGGPCLVAESSPEGRCLVHSGRGDGEVLTAALWKCVEDGDSARQRSKELAAELVVDDFRQEDVSAAADDADEPVLQLNRWLRSDELAGDAGVEKDDGHGKAGNERSELRLARMSAHA